MVLTRALTLINTIHYYSGDKSQGSGWWVWCGVCGNGGGGPGAPVQRPYPWSFLLRSRLCSCMDSWEGPEVLSIGSCFTWTRLNRLAWACCPFPAETERWRERQQEKEREGEVIVGQHYYPVMRSDLTCVQAEERAGSDNYCRIMSSRQGIYMVIERREEWGKKTSFSAALVTTHLCACLLTVHYRAR